MIVLADAFGLQRVAPALRQVNACVWMPCDARPVGDGDIYFLRESQAIPIAMSKWGWDTLRAEGCDPMYVPHGIPTDLYCPGDPQPYRDTLAEIDSSWFVAGICQMNRDPIRKGMAEAMMAFAQFHARHPDTLLSMHTVPVANPGINLQGLAAKLGIGPSVIFPESYLYDLGAISEQNMVDWYRGIDVLVQTSYAEGFGLPLVEAQACGTPVICTDASAMSELCGAGWLVSGTPFFNHGHGSFWTRPDVSDIEQAYECAYQAWKAGTLPKKEARDFALLYDADRVFEEHWIPVMEQLESLIKDKPA